MSSIVVQSPTRVDIAGGTLDLWPLYNFVRGAVTVNVAIDVWTRAELTPQEGEKIILESSDLGIKKEYKNLAAALADNDSQMLLLQTQLYFWQPVGGFSLKTSSQSPVGGGLGGSSSLTISIMKAFALFCSKPFSTTHQLVDAAHHIEAELLNTPTGTQDYYPAATGGLNILKYSSRGIEQESMSIDQTDFAKRFLLVYTGKSHHSGLNNFEVLKAAVAKEPRTMQALHDLKEIALRAEQVCRRGSWQELGVLFREEYEARLRLAPAFTCPEIEKLNEISLAAGAEAVKICGAGGGGCVLVWSPENKREGVADACQKAGFQVMSARPVNPL